MQMQKRADAECRSASELHAKELHTHGSGPPIGIDVLAKDSKATAKLLADALCRCSALERKQKSAYAAASADAGAKSQTDMELKALRMLGGGSKPVDIMNDLDLDVAVMQKILADYALCRCAERGKWVQTFFLCVRSILGRNTATGATTATTIGRARRNLYCMRLSRVIVMKTV
jgi:hypothetical protein